MNTTGQCFIQLKKALTRTMGASYACIEPNTAIDFQVRDYFHIILRTMPYSDHHTLDLRDAYVLRYKTDIEFAERIDTAIEGVKNYKELAELLHTLNQLLCKDESICRPEQTEHRLLNFREKYSDMSEVKQLLDKTAPLKRTLQNLLDDIERFDIEANFDNGQTTDLISLLEKGATIKSQLEELIETSRAKIQLIKFKQDYKNRFKKV